MEDPDRRRFTLVDAIVLMASVALGLAWIRLQTPWSSTASGVSRYGAILGMIDYFYYIYSPANFIVPLLIAPMAATLLLRLRRPRPPLRDLFRQPGAAACLAATIVSIATLIVLKGKVSCLKLIGGRFTDFPQYHNISLIGSLGYVVAAVWLNMVLSGTWKPEVSWLDRSGRFLGACCIVLLLFPVLI